MKTVIVVLACIIVGSFVIAYAVNTVRLWLAKRRLDKSMKGEKSDGRSTD